MNTNVCYVSGVLKGKVKEGIYYTKAEDPGKFASCTQKGCPPL